MRYRLFAVVLTGILAVSSLTLPSLAASFADVPPDHWAYQAIERLAKEGLIKGFPDGSFQGSQPMTRYEMATIVARLLDRLSAEDEAIKGLAQSQGDIAGMITDMATAVQGVQSDTKDMRSRVASLEAKASQPPLPAVQSPTVDLDKLQTKEEALQMDSELRSLITKLSVEFKDEIAQVTGSQTVYNQQISGLQTAVSSLEQQVKIIGLQLDSKVVKEDLEAYDAEISSLKAKISEQNDTIRRLYILSIVLAVAGILIK